VTNLLSLARLVVARHRSQRLTFDGDAHQLFLPPSDSTIKHTQHIFTTSFDEADIIDTEPYFGQ
jgi:hypothetical protein